MQNKNAIWIFSILLTVACLYQLTFTFVSNGVENDAKEFAINKLDSLIAVDGKMDQLVAEKTQAKFEEEYLANISNEPVYPLLGITYRDVKKQEINLGLDLQGGMNVTLEVSVVDVIKALSGFSTDETFQKAIKLALEKQKDSQADFVVLFGQSWNEVSNGGKLAAIFHTRENKEKFPREASNEEILKIITDESQDAIKRTEQVIRKRIDNLGVVQPKVQLLGSSGRILVELPGVKNKTRVRKILQGTAKLEFWETYDNKEIYPKIAEANNILATKLGGKKKKEDAEKATEIATDSTETATIEQDSTVVEEDNLLDQLSGDSDAADTSGVNATPSADDFAKENPLFGVLQPVLNQDEQGRYFPGEGPVIGYSMIKDTGKVGEFLRRRDIKSLFPKTKFFWAAKAFDEKETVLQLYAIKVSNRSGRAPLEGDGVADAFPSADPMGNPEVSMSMNAEGAKIWKSLTKENIGKSIAIVLDNYVYSAPNVMAEISGGRSSISGRFSVEEAEDLGNVLKAGKLPAPARIIEEAIVGPSLGKESINDGLWSFIFALVIILAYMVFYYAKAGLVANIALVANLFFVMGVLASLTATLTLPGIAGIVLTIGMSVDANVLIFERIREEMRNGKGLKLAISDGYDKAYSSIIDANITTLLTGVVLLIFGSGPIKGFATTLIIGILTSLFSAIFITRLVFEYLLDKKSAITFATNMTKDAFQNMMIPFVKKRKMYYLISGIVILAGFVSFGVRGLDQGVDFTGGRTYLVRFDATADIESVRKELSNTFIEDGRSLPPEVKIFGSSNQLKITTKYLINDNSENAESTVESALANGLTKAGGNFEIMSSQKVGPTIADDLKFDAMLSIFFALIMIFAYIVLRFRKITYGLGALAAMIHDVLIVLSIFSLFYGILPFSLEIDQAFIAAILTVVGYSINDTVVVFDRIREYLGIHKKKDMKEVINSALNSTLSRTFNTSISTFFVLLMIFIFGGEVIRGFVFALMVGVVVGTYSSLCIAAPMVIDLDKDNKLAENKK